VNPENGETCSDILKAIKRKVDREVNRVPGGSITESRNGEILIRLKPKDNSREELVEALKTNLVSRAAVRCLVRYDDIDI